MLIDPNKNDPYDYIRIDKSTGTAFSRVDNPNGNHAFSYNIYIEDKSQFKDIWDKIKS